MALPLTVELVPQTQCGANLHKLLKGKQWDTLRKETYRRADYQCEICSAFGVVLQTHEMWEYEDATGTRRLLRLVALCRPCHEVKHFGGAAANGRGTDAVAHLAEVNGWTEAEAQAHISSESAAWRRRNESEWTLDLSILDEYGIEPPPLQVQGSPYKEGVRT